MNKKAQMLGYNGLAIVVMLMLLVTAVGLLGGIIVKESVGTTNLSPADQAIISKLSPYNDTNNTLSEMKGKFVDPEGNAKTGITDVMNAMWSGIGGLITVMFKTPAMMGGVADTILFQMGMTGAGGLISALAVLFFIAVAIIAIVFMVRRI